MSLSRSPQLRTTGKMINGQSDVCRWGLTSTSQGQPEPSPSADTSCQRVGGEQDHSAPGSLVVTANASKTGGEQHEKWNKSHGGQNHEMSLTLKPR